MTDYKWKHIEDLPEGFNPPLQDNEILRKAWRDHQAKLAGSDAVAKFNERLAREWSIETGIIERLYSIDRGTTQVLIERGIDEALIPYGSTDRPAPEIVKILRTHEDVLQGLFDFIKEDRQLTVAYIRELHQAITRDQEFVDGQDQFGNPVKTKLIKGDWKQYPNNPKQTDGSVHEYCPPEHVQSEMEQLVEIHQEHVKKGISPEIQAAWLHHRFTQIHPFQDGNGRVARILASLILIKAGGLPFTVKREERDKYLDALEAADIGESFLFAKFISEQQTAGLIQAVEMSSRTRGEKLGDIFDAGVEKLIQREKAIEFSEPLKRLIKGLITIGTKSGEAVVNDLNGRLRRANPIYFAVLRQGDLMPTVARDKNALFNMFDLVISDYQVTKIGVGIFGFSFSEREVVAAGSYMYQGMSIEEPISESNRIAIEITPFIISESQLLSEIEPAFKEWLTTVFTVGLAEWEKRIR